MECTEVRGEFRDWSRGRPLPIKAQEHLNSCDECDNLWRRERELTDSFASLRALPDDASASAAVRAAVVGALPPAQPGPAGSPWRTVLAMAAAVLLTVLAGWYLSRRPAQVLPSSTASHTVPPVLYTDFFPLSRRALDHDEPAQVVRIRLPRREMRRFGLPVTEELERSPVEADVVIGQDGTARAVRFVSLSQ